LGAWHLREHGVSTLEYAVILAAVVTALVVGQFYLRRAISHKWRESVDSVFGQGRQYSTDPGKQTVVVVED
jgi:Flp pilus assembly pilin Flp